MTNKEHAWIGFFSKQIGINNRLIVADSLNNRHDVAKVVGVDTESGLIHLELVNEGASFVIHVGDVIFAI